MTHLSYLGHMTTAANTPAGQVPRWSIQDRLRKAREHAGMTQGQLADRIGVARNSVSNYESGATRPRRIVLNAWSMVTGVPLQWLEAGDDDDDPEVRHQGLEPRTRWFEASQSLIEARYSDGWFCTEWPNLGHAA